MSAPAATTEQLVTVTAADLEWIADDAESIAETTSRIDAVASRLRDLNQSHDGIYMVFGLGACGFHRGFGLADPRLPSLEPAVLRERVREWADELERTGESISSTAEFMSNRIRDALEGADGEAAS